MTVLKAFQSLNPLNQLKTRKTTCIGLDHGNGFVKAKSDKTNFVLPSQLARAEDFSGELYGKAKDFKTYRMMYDEGEERAYAWGKDVTKAKFPIKSFATEDRYTKLPYKMLTSFALAELIGSMELHGKVNIVTGVPSYEKGTKWEKDLEEALKKIHLVNVNGIEKRVDVESIKIVPQPLGTVLYHYLDDDGFVLDDKFESEDFYAGVIDIGSGTSDLDGLKELEVVHKDRATIRKGMFNAYDEIASFIKEEDPRADVDKERVEAWIRTKEMIGQNPFIYNPTSKIYVDFTKAARNAFRNLAEDIIMEIDQRWNKSHFNEIYLTGGGAKTLATYFKEWDKDIIVVENHQMANAHGFYRFAKYLQLEEDK